MAKPKDAYYFSHDSNARHDPDIMKLRTVYGNEGYGNYFMIVEILRDQQFYKYEIDDYTFDAIAFDLRKDSDFIKKFINDCIEKFNLFERDEKYFWSNSLLRRMKIRDDKAKKMRKNAEKRWESIEKGKQEKDHAKAMQLHSKSNALNKSKVNKTKLKETKRNKTKGKIFDEVLFKWNVFAELHKLPKILKLTTDRENNLSERIQEPEFNLDEILKKAKSSEFLMKKMNPPLNFDFIINNNSNYIKILEGKYNDAKSENGFGRTSGRQGQQNGRASNNTSGLSADRPGQSKQQLVRRNNKIIT